MASPNPEGMPYPNTPEIYGDSLRTLLAAEITPETVETYATTALQAAVDLSEKFRSETRATTWDNRHEDRAFNAVGLGNINQILTRIVEIDDSINRASKIINSLVTNSAVFIPPDTQTARFRNGTAEFTQKQTIHRAQTVLFILENDFGIDISDSTSINIEKGAVLKTMVRQDGYVYIEVGALNRVIFVCDESENASFIFDTQRISEIGLQGEGLRVLTKNQLREIIALHPSTGKRVTHTKNFVRDVKTALNSCGDEHSTVSTANGYLLPRADANVIATNKLAKQLGVHAETIVNAATELGIPVCTYTNGRGPFSGIDSQAINQLRQHELIAMPHGSDYEAESLEALHRKLRIGKETLRQLCQDSHIQIGWYKFGTRHASGEGIVAADINRLLATPTLGTPVGDEAGAIGTNALLQLLAPLNHGTLIEVLDDLQLDLREFRFGKHIARGFFPSDINAIRQHPRVCIPDAQHYDAISLRDVANYYGTTPHTVRRAAKESKVRIGEFRFNYTPGYGLLKSDVEKLASTATFKTAPADSGMISVNQLREELDVMPNSVLQAAERQGIEATLKKINGRRTSVFTPEERNKIRQDEKMATPNSKTYGARSLNDVRNELQITRSALDRIIALKGIQLGEYRFGPNYTQGILPQDLETIRQELT